MCFWCGTVGGRSFGVLVFWVAPKKLEFQEFCFNFIQLIRESLKLQNHLIFPSLSMSNPSSDSIPPWNHKKIDGNFQQKKIMLKTVFQRLFLSFLMHFNIFSSLAFSISLCKIIKHNKVISNVIFFIKSSLPILREFYVQSVKFKARNLRGKSWKEKNDSKVELFNWSWWKVKQKIIPLNLNSSDNRVIMNES